MSLKRAKIIATLGTASANKETIAKMVASGANVFRLNFSHGSHTEKSNIIRIIREIEEESKQYIAILADLQGPKIRIGDIPNQELIKGQTVTLKLADQTTELGEIVVPHPEVFQTFEVGNIFYISDGFLQLRVKSLEDNHIKASVIAGGPISSHKGINLPGKYLPIPAITEQDKVDLKFALAHNVDWVAISFVQRVEDAIEARKLINSKARLMVKLERPMALENLEEITDNVDAVMVARGDLGIEIPLSKVPFVQKNIINICRKKALPVVVATEMLESMIKNPRPTRAEVSDVANAVYEGADCVMLSGETAIGHYPVETIAMMNDIVIESEQNEIYKQIRIKERQKYTFRDDSDAIASGAIDIAVNLHCKAIATFTQTGATTMRASSARTMVPVLSLTPNIRTARAMALIWGVFPIKTNDVRSFDEMVGKATRISRAYGFTQNGDRITVTAGIPFGTPGKTNIVRVCTVGEHEKT